MAIDLTTPPPSTTGIKASKERKGGRGAARLWGTRASFPRRQREPWVSKNFFPYTGLRDDWLARALEAARIASRSWHIAMRSGVWGAVDGDCLTLAVFDKVFEMNLKARPGLRPGPLTRLRSGKTEPRMHASIDEWREEMGVWAERVYDEALGTLPSVRSVASFAFPPLHDVLDIVRTLLDLGFRPDIDAAAPWSHAQCYGMTTGFSPSMLGKWDPHLPLRPPTYDEEIDMIVYK